MPVELLSKLKFASINVNHQRHTFRAMGKKKKEKFLSTGVIPWFGIN
jgi:hypothetical protein